MVSMPHPDQASLLSIGSDEMCPFCSGDAVCQASLSMLQVAAATRLRFCATDDYDACPFYLSKMIRRR